MQFFSKWILHFCILITIYFVVLNCSENSDILSVDSESSDEYNINTEYAEFYEQFSGESFTLEDSCIMIYMKNLDTYAASAINIKEGSFMKIPAKSLIAPEKMQGENVVLTMKVKFDSAKKELDFTFGPGGCAFTEPVELCLSWRVLNSARATLYYLDASGNKIEHLPDQIDKKNKRMILQIKHFSRYAVAYSN